MVRTIKVPEITEPEETYNVPVMCALLDNIRAEERYSLELVLSNHNLLLAVKVVPVPLY